MKIAEVKINSEGQQIKRLLLQYYKIDDPQIAIKLFAKEAGLYETTLARYLRNCITPTEKLRERLEKKFNKGFSELVDTVYSQLNRAIISIQDNIHYYDSESDLVIANNIIKQCNRYRYTELALRAEINLGRIKYNLKMIDAREIIKSAIEKAESLSFYETQVSGVTNLAYLEYTENSGNIQAARNLLKSLEKLVKKEDISPQVEYRYWYTYGITLQLIKQPKQSRRLFKKALELSIDPISQIKCLINIAINLKNEKKYLEAIKIYRKLLRTQEGSQWNMKCSIYNNIANTYLAMGNKEVALNVIKMAIIGMPDDLHINKKIIIYDTYLDISEDCTYIMNNLFKALDHVHHVNENRKLVIDIMNKLILNLIKYRDYDSLYELVVKLEVVIDKEVDLKAKNQFKIYYAEATLELLKNGWKLRKKGC